MAEWGHIQSELLPLITFQYFVYSESRDTSQAGIDKGDVNKSGDVVTPVHNFC
jgi:hypothetical protein